MRSLVQALRSPGINNVSRRLFSELPPEAKPGLSVTREEMGAKFETVRMEIAALSQKLESKFDVTNSKIDIYDNHMNKHMSNFKWAMGGLSAAIGFFGYQVVDTKQELGKLQGKLEHKNNHVPTLSK